MRLQQTLSQPEQEPVAWMFQDKETGNVTFIDKANEAKLFEQRNPHWSKAIPLYTK